MGEKQNNKYCFNQIRKVGKKRTLAEAGQVKSTEYDSSL